MAYEGTGTTNDPKVANAAGTLPSFKVLPVPGGGTGATTLTGVLIGNGTSAVTASAVTQHDLLVGGSANAITSVAPSATSGIPVISQGAAADPTFGTAVVAGGGTGATTLTGVLIGNGTSAITGQSITQHDVLIGGASNAITSLAPSVTSGIPVVSQGAAADPIFGTAAVAGGGTGATTLTGVLIGNGTSAVTGQAITQHDLLVGGSSNAITSVAPSATSGIPVISQGASADPTFGTAVVAGGGTGATTLTGVLTGNGTSAITANAVTQHGLLLGGASNAVSSLGVAKNGQIPIGSTGANPVLATISSGAGITVTNGAGTISISSSGGGLTWTDVTGTSQAMAVSNGYLADNVALVTLTLPSTAPQFSVMAVVGSGSGGWKIAQNAGQRIILGSSGTTVGVTGFISSTNANDCVYLLATVGGSSTLWTITNSVGNITIS